MRILRAAAIALVSATPLCFSIAPAFAEEMHDKMMGEEMMHHDMRVTCTIAKMDEMGMTVMFHNMGGSEIPAGTKGHWMIHGVAQGDVDFMKPVAAGGMKEQMYMSHDMMHGSMRAPCSVSMM